jgi:hypothetical protein
VIRRWLASRQPVAPTGSATDRRATQSQDQSVVLADRLARKKDYFVSRLAAPIPGAVQRERNPTVERLRHRVATGHWLKG